LSYNLLIIGCSYGACLLYSVSFTDLGSKNLSIWAWCILYTFLGSSFLRYLGKDAPNQLLRKEALAIVGFSWIGCSLVGSLPYILIEGCSPVDAFFESASGFTTTGASIFSDIESIPPDLLFWRSMTQWIGGLGMITLFVFIVTLQGPGSKFLFKGESSVQMRDLGSSTVREGIRDIVLVYLFLSVVCCLAFYWCGMSMTDAVCHMFATVSTGGFSTHSESIAFFQSPGIEWACILFMLLGGTNFPALVHLFIYRKGRIHSEIIFYLLSFFLFSAIIVITMKVADGSIQGMGQMIREAAFQVASIMTSTGFASTDYEQWIPAEHMILMTAMVIGGCTGSTAGGLKGMRILIALRICLANLERAFRPNVVRSMDAFGITLTDQDRENTLNYIFILTVICFAAMPTLAVLEPMMSEEGVKSSVLACLFNVGPGFAEVGATDNYGFMGDPSKILLSLIMIMGRVEVYAILAFLLPSFWKKN
jgi:trk system potassium uptake protein TrkH